MKNWDPVITWILTPCVRIANDMELAIRVGNLSQLTIFMLWTVICARNTTWSKRKEKTFGCAKSKGSVLFSFADICIPSASFRLRHAGCELETKIKHEDEPLIEIVGEAKDFTELLEKALALKPRIVLMDLHMRDEYKFKPEFVRSELQASAGHVLAMSLFYDDEAVELSNSYGASLLLDKSKLITDLVRTVEKLCA